jgi:RecJ-like exonuclease
MEVCSLCKNKGYLNLMIECPNEEGGRAKIWTCDSCGGAFETDYEETRYAEWIDKKWYWFKRFYRRLCQLVRKT